MQNAKLRYNNDVGDLILAIEGAMFSLEMAMDEIKGLGELDDLFNGMNGDLQQMEARKDQLESYMSGEYQAQAAEMAREYYRSVM